MNDEKTIIILETLQKYVKENLNEYVGLPVDVNKIEKALNKLFQNWYPDSEVTNVKYLDDNRIQCDIILYPYVEINFELDKDGNIVHNNTKENKNE